ncbi:type 11 methyltransferase [Vibrio nigripulchritudo ATCC 27043]|uniref:toll/interleukin-1 receptor domain-containing protein n=1 Tax=Vibrio nigripulchritudo TaxID=28173 RepID=UPI00021C3E4D|nr:toll/interleukin-1 receptor domain-containing protein [Vibrio nigripulchritudo]EGU60140.1 type 11 methyltransferase [Vibrio nigripulchritudo ATCC 27043]
MKEYDVFLSHSSNDKPWVEDLKKAMECYDIKSWLDKDEIAPGELFAQSLEFGMASAKCAVIVVSKKSMDSKWVESEYFRALSIINNRENNNFKLIPIILSQAEIPPFLSDRNYIDFGAGNFSHNVWKLVWGITGTKPSKIIDVIDGAEAIAKADVLTEDEKFSLKNRLTHLISHYGLDNEQWATAISSQYFLASIAKICGYTSRSDYQSLLNKFLKSFHLQLDNSFSVDKSHILVTPEELNSIVSCMEKEDEIDNYFQRSSKTKWQNIDKWGLHDNYLYGLAVDIANDSQYEVLEQVRKAALKRLICKPEGARLDDNGGWYPYRVPWITARILVSLSVVKDRDCDSKVIAEALDSLSLRIFENSYWKSGVGDWVTKWESTALCLEAFEALDAVSEYHQKISSVLKYVVENENEWLGGSPSLSSEENSNRTLSAVLMISVLLRIRDKNPVFNAINFNVVDYFDYLNRCVDILEGTSVVNVRQFCTIPQISYYILKSIE